MSASAGTTPAPSGVAVVDKAPGWTSHDVVGRARRVLGTRKVGHAGTLDPDATGVLVLGVGSATRLLRFISDLPKSYVGEVVLGVETDTLDASGEVLARYDMSGVDVADLRRVAAGLTGPIMQVPPMVSAIKVGGRKLYELAREGVEVERAARPVVVHRFEVGEAVESGVYPIEVDCSSGTYIRSLAASLGAELGGGAHLRALRRTAVGGFHIDDARPVDDVILQPAATAVSHLPQLTADAEGAAAVAHGKVLPREVLGALGDGPWAVVDATGVLLAVYEVHRDPAQVKPALVLA